MKLINVPNLRWNGSVPACLIAIVSLPAFCQAQSPPSYTIATIAGNNTAGSSGDSGQATSAQLYGPNGFAVDSSGNIYIADQSNHKVRKIAKDGTITTVAGNGTAGYGGDGAAATSANLHNPSGVALDSAGNLYIADSVNAVIRKVTGTTISTVAGIPLQPGYSGDGQTATTEELNLPSAVVLDSAGNLYIADAGNFRIRKVAASGQIITTVVGNGSEGSSGDGGLAVNAHLDSPRGLAIDAAGNLYIADTNSNKIREVSGGRITAVAGNSIAGFTGDGGAATSAELYKPSGVAVDASGNVYIGDTTNSRIRMVLAATGNIYTIAGNGRFGYQGDGGPATSAELNFPTGVAVTSAGNVYVADNNNNVVRLLTPAASVGPGVPPSIGGVQSAGAYGAFPPVAPGTWMEIYGTNLAATTREWTLADFNGVSAPISLERTSVKIGGQDAFVRFVSPGQVNVQVPSTVAAGAQNVILSTAVGASNAFSVTVNSAQPGLLAPPQFKIGGKQYVAALFPDYTTFVAPPGAIPGVTSRQAAPGDTLIIYGIGFGPVIPNIPAGQIVQFNNQLAQSLQVSFGTTPAVVNYAGLATGYVGLYQLNVMVPSVPNNDAQPLTFSLGGGTPQTLYTAVHN